MSDTSTILNEIKQAVVSVDPGAEVILFGSRARGDYHEESDWDVLVLTDNAVNDKFRLKIIEAVLDVQLMNRVSINPLIRNRENWTKAASSDLYVNVMEDRQLI